VKNTLLHIRYPGKVTLSFCSAIFEVPKTEFRCYKLASEPGTLGILKRLMSLPNEIFHIVKSLAYFEDSEQYADPIVSDKTVTWSKVKHTIREAVNNLIQ